MKSEPKSSGSASPTKASPARKCGRARSAALEAIHSAAHDLHSAGGIDKKAMRQFDRACLSHPHVGADDEAAED